MKIILRDVKIYGYDPNNFKEFENEGKITRQYSAPLYISQADRDLIDLYIYGKCETTRDGEILFYGKNKQPIPVFDAERIKIKTPINEVFLADVSILIDEYVKKDGETNRYSKCLGIHYLSKVENEEPKIIVKEEFKTYDDIFAEDIESKPEEFGIIKKPEDIGKQPENQPLPQTVNSIDGQPFDPTIDDLPF